MGVYVPPNDVPTVHQTEEALAEKPTGIDTILMVDLNVLLEDTQNES